MAGDWIKIEHTLPDKPEVVYMASCLNIDQDTVTGKLIRVWAWADQNSLSGNDIAVTSSFIDRLTACVGFSEAMRKAGWLSGRDGRLMIPNFERHNGKTAKSRSNTARRMSNMRACHRDSDGDVTQQASQNASPEKRREETPNGVEPSAPKVRKKPEGDHAEFIQRWTDEFPKHHDGENYVFQGAKDGSQVSRLLKAISKTPEEWQRCFVAAWKRPDLFNCKAAASISGFASRVNEIISELNAAKRGPGTNGDRPEAFRVPMVAPPQRPAHLDDPKT